MTIFLVLLGLILVSALSVYIVSRLRAKLEQDLEAEMREQGNIRFQELEEGIFEWLGLLQLPILGEQTKREEAAHLLSIVLVERLMLQRMPNCHQNKCRK